MNPFLVLVLVILAVCWGIYVGQNIGYQRRQVEEIDERIKRKRELLVHERERLRIQMQVSREQFDDLMRRVRGES
jgi:hypothetical protein